MPRVYAWHNSLSPQPNPKVESEPWVIQYWCWFDLEEGTKNQLSLPNWLGINSRGAAGAYSSKPKCSNTQVHDCDQALNEVGQQLENSGETLDRNLERICDVATKETTSARRFFLDYHSRKECSKKFELVVISVVARRNWKHLWLPPKLPTKWIEQAYKAAIDVEFASNEHKTRIRISSRIRFPGSSAKPQSRIVKSGFAPKDHPSSRYEVKNNHSERGLD